MDYCQNIYNSSKTIYDPINPDNDNLYIPTTDLEKILSEKLINQPVQAAPNRSRSKSVKKMICDALKYRSSPSSFRRGHPQFVGQNFDVYTQKRLNVQIWNEGVCKERRYVFLHLNQQNIITSVRVISGEDLAQYDKTGTLTQKYQATMPDFKQSFCSQKDTCTVDNWINNYGGTSLGGTPIQYPKSGQCLLRIDKLYDCLKQMVNQKVDYLDADQERNRGAGLHKMICECLGYTIYEDDGKYPDIKNQLLEIKLQTSSTIDLGQHSPEDNQIIVSIDNTNFYSQDIRYAIFEGRKQGNQVLLNNLYLVTGAEFSKYFPLCQGRKKNCKIQLHLPNDFFGDEENIFSTKSSSSSL